MTQSTQRWQQLDASHHLHPFSDLKEMRETAKTRVISKAKGVYIYDSDGNKILDAMSGLWCVNMGYGQKHIIETAYAQMHELPYYNSFFGTTHPPAAELTALLAEIAPAHMNQAFFTSGGSEANDTVVRMARHYWETLGQASKSIIISRENAYHGSTMAGASLGGMAYMHAQGGLPIPGIVHIKQPYAFNECVKAGAEIDRAAFGLEAARALEEKIDELGEDRVAAFIAEPIQGAGGVIIPPDTYWPEIQRICKRRNILLVVDEVICGFGRTGEWFGSTYYGIEPDLMPIAKGMSSGYLPIGGVMVADRVADVLMQENVEFAHGFTYSGHPVCAAAAIANIQLMQSENIIERVRNVTAPYLAKKWQTLSDHPLVGEARTLGILGALEIVENKATYKRFEDSNAATSICRSFCFENGLVMRAVTDKMIIAPPLVISESEIDELVEKAWRCLDLTAKAIAD
jgi:putrescine aminotransferase